MANNDSMTALSRQMYNQILSRMDTQQVYALMKDGFALRSLADKLQVAAPQYERSALRSVLTEGMQKNHPDKKPESIARNVSNWFRGNQTSLARDYAVEICMILRLNVETAQELISSITEENLHLRDPEDVVLCYCLNHGQDYLKYQELCERVREMFLLRNNGEDEDWLQVVEDFSNGVLYWDRLTKEQTALLLLGEHTSDAEIAALFNLGARQLKEKQKNFFALNPETRWARLRLLKENWFTNTVRAAFDDPQTEAELFDFLDKNRNTLGKYHNTAYVEFMRMMGVLTKPGDMVNGWEKNMSVRDALDLYLFTGDAARFKQRLGKDDLLGKSIISYWPEETQLSRMAHRETDVTRKVLILLYLATDDHYEETDELEDLWADEGIELDAMERFELYQNRMNDFLAKCGYRALDPRSPFDWMILRCLFAPEDEDEAELWEGNRLLKEYFEASFDAVNGKEIQNQ